MAYEVAGERQPGLGGGRGGAQGEDGVAVGAGGPGEDHLAVGLHHTVRERSALRRGLGAAEGAAEHGAEPGPDRAGAQHPVDLAPGDVGGVRDRARGLVHLAQQGVGVEQPERLGHLVLFLEGEAVGGAAGGEVEGVAGVEEGAAGPVEPFARGVRDPGGGDGAQGGGVAETAAGLLEVGFQEELQLARPLGPLLAQLVEGGEAFGAWLRQSARIAVRREATSPRSPATGRASSSPSCTLRSSPAVLRASPGVRTEWSRARPRSQTGYQTASARAATAATSALPSWSRSRSRSLRGESSPRP